MPKPQQEKKKKKPVARARRPSIADTLREGRTQGADARTRAKSEAKKKKTTKTGAAKRAGGGPAKKNAAKKGKKTLTEALDDEDIKAAFDGRETKKPDAKAEARLKKQKQKKAAAAAASAAEGGGEGCELHALFLHFPMFVPSLSWQNDRFYTSIAQKGHFSQRGAHSAGCGDGRYDPCGDYGRGGRVRRQLRQQRGQEQGEETSEG
eukprot:COSAG06_NODE_182_length_20899_cov_89.175048_27_plen_207_part_00